jgi:molybdenum cofactor synthesis domain-containing protein
VSGPTDRPTRLQRATATATIALPSGATASVEDQRAQVVAAAQLAVKELPFSSADVQGLPEHDLDLSWTETDGGVQLEVHLRAVTALDPGPHALAAANAAAITLVDGLGVEGATIGEVALTSAGPSFAERIEDATAVVLVLSDTVAAGKKPDTAGRSVADRLEAAGFTLAAYEVLSDDPDGLATRLDHWLAEAPQLVVTVGGTGLGPRDQTVEVVQPRLTTEIPGLMEAARAYGQARTPYAMLSRGVAGLIDTTVVVTFPGSRRGAEETLDAILVGLIHLIDVVRISRPHAGGYE